MFIPPLRSLFLLRLHFKDIFVCHDLKHLHITNMNILNNQLQK